MIDPLNAIIFNNGAPLDPGASLSVHSGLLSHNLGINQMIMVYCHCAKYILNASASTLMYAYTILKVKGLGSSLLGSIFRGILCHKEILPLDSKNATVSFRGRRGASHLFFPLSDVYSNAGESMESKPGLCSSRQI